MKKTFKKILSAVLVLAMTFGALTAFAADSAPIHLDGEEIFSVGELKEGSNTVSYPEGEEYAYVSFDAEKDGYYIFVHESQSGYRYSHWLTWFETDESGEITDGKNHIFSEFTDDPLAVVTLFELEAGENKFLLDWGRENVVGEKVTVSYLGAEITDVDFSAGTDYAMIYGCDIYDAYYSEADYGDSYGYAFYADDVVITFDSGEKLEFDDFGTFPCMCETKIEDGVYDIGVFLGEKTVPASIEVHPVTYYVENVEADSPEKFIMLEYYDGGSEFIEYEGSYTVTQKNGNKIKVNSGENVLIPGANPEGYTIYSYINDRKDLVVTEFGNSFFEEYEYTVQAASDEQNFNRMTENISYIFNDFKWEADYLYEIMANAGSKADTLRAFGTWISHINNNVIFVLADIVGEFFDFIGYTILHL